MAKTGISIVLDEAGGDVVLRGERIGGAEHELGAAGDERAGEVGGLGGDVEARGHLAAGEGLFLGEALADEREDGHVAVGPQDALSCRRRPATCP